ncbi:MAG: Fe-S oxidoreductase [Candidatus Thermoplasmatota archaeon]
MNILLVEPNFPISPKSKYFKLFMPLGLLKLASYYRKKGHKIKLVKGNILPDFHPDKILITSLFTYWAKYVKECVQFYKTHFPYAKIVVGGIYASLMPQHCKEFTGCDEVFIGIHKSAEKCKPAYQLLFNSSPPYQILHTSRGCVRKCPFCGVWKIEPQINFKKSIKKEICSNNLLFFDNNLLANPFIKKILNEISMVKWKGKPVRCEAVCGIDYRFILKDPELAILLKKARFESIRIAWDWHYNAWKDIEKALRILQEAGYRNREMYVFMIYNWEIPFREMEKKRIKCWEWKVQIADCRYRPLNQTYDNYDPKKHQTTEDYYIHPKWTDGEVKQFRKNVRSQNICVRYNLNYYSPNLERCVIPKKEILNFKNLSFREAKKILTDAWDPSCFTPP